jgi:hypothetical protein
MAINVLNTDAGLSGKTIATVEDPQTITGLKTFDRDPSAPFAVSSGSAVVSNLNADQWDGEDLPADPGADRILFWDESEDALKYLTVGTGLTITTDTIAADSGNDGITDDGTDVTAIKFAPVQVPAADVNTLDDYEEGTFSPTFIGVGGQSGQVYSAQVGWYTKIGKMVFFGGRVTLSTLGTITGVLGIGGLPFTCENVANARGQLTISAYANCGSVSSNFGGYVEPNTTYAILTHFTSSSDSTTLTQGNLTNTASITFAGMFKASA